VKLLHKDTHSGHLIKSQDVKRKINSLYIWRVVEYV